MMTVFRGFVITIASGLAFAIAGGILGYGLGVILPDYYRIVFRIPPQLELDPVQVGLGLGISQGLLAGLLVGLVIVGIVTWYNIQVAHSDASKSDSIE